MMMMMTTMMNEEIQDVLWLTTLNESDKILMNRMQNCYKMSVSRL